MRIAVALEAEVWKLALQHFGAADLRLLLKQAQEDLPRSPNGSRDSFQPMPVEMFGAEILTLIRSVPELYQMTLIERQLLMPGKQRHYLFGTLLQAVPLDQLSESLRDRRFALDQGL